MDTPGLTEAAPVGRTVLPTADLETVCGKAHTLQSEGGYRQCLLAHLALHMAW